MDFHLVIQGMVTIFSFAAGLLSFLLSAASEMSTSRSTAMLCSWGWRVKFV